jgi:hypothetical protein
LIPGVRRPYLAVDQDGWWDRGRRRGGAGRLPGPQPAGLGAWGRGKVIDSWCLPAILVKDGTKQLFFGHNFVTALRYWGAGTTTTSCKKQGPAGPGAGWGAPGRHLPIQSGAEAAPAETVATPGSSHPSPATGAVVCLFGFKDRCVHMRVVHCVRVYTVHISEQTNIGFSTP